jgi:hypothetical protein
LLTPRLDQLARSTRHLPNTLVNIGERGASF